MYDRVEELVYIYSLSLDGTFCKQCDIVITNSNSCYSVTRSLFELMAKGHNMTELCENLQKLPETQRVSVNTVFKIRFWPKIMTVVVLIYNKVMSK